MVSSRLMRSNSARVPGANLKTRISSSHDLALPISHLRCRAVSGRGSRASRNGGRQLNGSRQIVVGVMGLSAVGFRMLGPLEFFDGRRWSSVGAAKQRGLLAGLLIIANRPVSTDQLIAELWGERP